MLCMIRWILCTFQNKKNIIVCQKLKILLPWKSAHCVLISVQISSYKMLGQRFLVLSTEVKSFDTSAQVFWKSFDILESLQLHCRDNCARHPHHGNLSLHHDFHFIMIMTRIPGFLQVLRMATGVPSNMSALPWEGWPWWSMIMVSIWFPWIPWIPEWMKIVATVFITLP